MTKTEIKKRDRECHLQSLCESYLTMRHIPYLHLTTAIKRRIAGRFYTFPVEGMTGYPDLIIFMPKGKMLLVELKTEKGKVSSVQSDIFSKLGNHGHAVVLIRSFDDFKCLVKQED